MVIKPTLVLTYEFKATPQRVFDVVTQSEHLNRYFTSSSQVDLQVGGKFSNDDGDTGKFLKLAVPRHLVFSYNHEKLGVDTEVDLTFVASGPLKWTKLRLVQKGLDADKVSAEAYTWMTARWNYLAAGLARYLSKQGRISFDTWRAQTKPVYETRR
jgi:uncharacterized protein YndB with AHSA1/START domain